MHHPILQINYSYHYTGVNQEYDFLSFLENILVVQKRSMKIISWLHALDYYKDISGTLLNKPFSILMPARFPWQIFSHNLQIFSVGLIQSEA